MAAAGDTVSVLFGARPPNLTSDGSHVTAKMCSIWTMFFTPTLLCHRFQKPWFYKHFLHLVHLLKLCMEFELTQEQIDELEEGFKSWVKDYEQYVKSPVFSSYRLTPPQLLLSIWPPPCIAACPITIYELLHIAPSIQVAGPVWAYWAFPMEHYCGELLLNIKSCHYPYKSLDHYVTAWTHLTQINYYITCITSLVMHELSLQPLPTRCHDFSLPWCKSI